MKVKKSIMAALVKHHGSQAAAADALSMSVGPIKRALAGESVKPSTAEVIEEHHAALQEEGAIPKRKKRAKRKKKKKEGADEALAAASSVAAESAGNGLTLRALLERAAAGSPDDRLARIERTLERIEARQETMLRNWGLGLGILGGE